MTVLSTIVVASSGLFLLGLAIVIIAWPARAERFLSSFASSALGALILYGVSRVVISMS